jgi:opacity protein-like surface antigen
MTASRHISTIAVIGLLLVARDAGAVRYVQRPLLWNRTAVSGYLGEGLPVGVFASDDIPGDGNQADWPIDWTVEVEHFAGRTWSLGFSAAFTSYEDQDDPELLTNLNTFSGFFRVVVPTNTSIRPYFRAGMGGVQVEFEQVGEFRVDADYSFSFQAGAGLLWLPARWLGLNAQALYYYGATEDAYIAENNTIVGFDVQYFAFAGGVSLFFP